ncbi:MAG: Na+/H+ antiporter subunit E [Propionibacteriales bacterium]|nr:Na+/H+ antiporter subunit E [Propionibacteriales bacterium]
MMPRWRIVVGLTAIWLLLWGAVTPTLVVGGVLTSVLVLMLFPFPQAPWRWTLRPWPTLTMLLRFVVDLVRASVQVSWLALRPAAPPRSAVVRVPLETRNELLVTVTAELVSLVPGSLLVELDPEQPALYLHVLDARSPEHLERAIASVHEQERRVVEAMAPKDERDAYRRRPQEVSR